MTMLLYVSAGGLAGTLARFLLQELLQARTTTVVINILGSFALGFVARYAAGTALMTPELRAAITIGFCGAFTTMSAFSYETMGLLHEGAYMRTMVYAGGTIVGCLAAVIGGTLLAGRFH